MVKVHRFRRQIRERRRSSYRRELEAMMNTPSNFRYYCREITNLSIVRASVRKPMGKKCSPCMQRELNWITTSIVDEKKRRDAGSCECIREIETRRPTRTETNVLCSLDRRALFPFACPTTCSVMLPAHFYWPTGREMNRFPKLF